MDNLQRILQTADATRFLALAVFDTQGQLLAIHHHVQLNGDHEASLQTVATRIFQYPSGLDVLSTFNESIFYDLDGQKLVCRVIQSEQKSWLFVVLCPADRAYRQALKTLSRNIQAALESDC